MVLNVRALLLQTLMLTGTLCSGCATNEICLKPVGDRALTPSGVVAGTGGAGEVVTWGGVLIETRNQTSDTELEIIAYPLDGCGRPTTRNQPLGRFIARRPGYLEPRDYRAGRQVTATGRVQGIAEGQVGEARVPLPILDDSATRLWPERPAPAESGWYRPMRPLISIGIGGGSGHVGGGIGVSF